MNSQKKLGVLIEKIASHRRRKSEKKLLLEEIDNHPNNPELLHRLGLIEFEKSFFSSSIEIFKKAIDLDNNFIEPYFSISTAMREQHNYEESEKYIVKLEKMSLSSYNWRVNLERGLNFRYQREWNQCEKKLKKAIALSPETAELYYHIGLMYFEIKDFEAAVECFQTAIEKNHYFIEPYFSISGTMREQRRFEDAEKYIVLAEKLELPSLAWKIFLERGLNFRYQRKWLKCEEMIRKAIEHSPEDAKLQYHLGLMFFEKKTYESASLCFKKALELDKYYIESYFGLAATMRAMNRFDIAESCLRSFEKLGVSHLGWRVSQERSLCYLSRKKLDESEIVLNEAIAHDNENPILHFQLGIIHFEKQEYGTAIDCFMKARSCDKYFIEAYFSLAATNRELKKIAEAKRHINDFENLNIPSLLWRVYMDLAFTFRSENKMAESKEMLKKSIELFPENAELHYCLGLIDFEEKEFELAEVSFKEALRYDKYNTEIYFSLTSLMRELNRYEDAKLYLQKISDLGIDTVKWRIHFDRSICCYSVGNKVLGKKELNLAIDCNNVSAMNMILIGDYFALNDDYYSSVVCYSKALENDIGCILSRAL